MSVRSIVGIVLMATGVLFAPLQAQVRAAELLDVRFGITSATKTRIVFDLDEATTYSIRSSDVGAGQLIVTLDGLEAPRRDRRRFDGGGQVEAARYDPDGQRQFVFDLKNPVLVETAFLIPPSAANSRHRLVIDLKKTTRADFLNQVEKSVPPVQVPRYESIVDVIESSMASGTREANATASDSGAALEGTPEPRLKSKPQGQPEPLKIIVIDAGHGGSDPGAIGQNGTKESVVTLAAAKALGEILLKRGGYKVVYTRPGDERLALEERSPIARDAKADLFISLHADALEQKNVRGGSVYTLSPEGAERSAREARVNGELEVFDLNIDEQEPEVGGILFDLAQRRTGNESSRFADILVSKISGVTPLLNKSRRTKNLMVLLAPDVPAVLFELAYISNEKDEANLNSKLWRKKTMGAVADAIDAYFEAEAFQRHASAVSGTGN